MTKRAVQDQRELIHLLNRREMLGFLGVTAASAFVGCGADLPGSQTQSIVASCLVSPQQTEGPYFVDEKLNRSDIRVDPVSNSVSQGLPLRLVLRVQRVTSNTCKPLPGATVDIWHCDAIGIYSDVQDGPGGFGDTRGKKFLRGYQVTNAEGQVEFLTIYPGWYPGRTVHIHFKIRTEPGSEVGYEFTSQLFFDETITDQVHSQPPYANKGRRDTTNSRDGIYRRGGKDLMLQLSKEADSYRAQYDVGFLLPT